ncbi:MAG: hypothetical protein GC162_02275 [Planctomycetes bacterium]|nr:hypothetical protein [Planctomycetota bacterium]
MSDPNDQFKQLAQAASRKSSGPSARHRLPKKKKKSIASIVVPIIALGGMIIVVVVLVQHRPKDEQVEAPPPPPPVAAPVDLVATPRQMEIKNQADALWAKLSKLDKTPRFAPLIQEASDRMAHLQQLWDEKKFDEVQDYFPKASDALGAVEQLDIARSQAMDADKASAAMRGEAEKLGAPDLTKALWAKGNEQLATAKQEYDAEKYQEAGATWLAGKKSFEQSRDLSQMAITAQDMKKEFATRSVQNFSKDELDEVGGEAWVKANALMKSGEESFNALAYDKAFNDYKEARGLIDVYEARVKQIYGTYMWAVRAGYDATGLLLSVAAGRKLDDKMIEPLGTAMTNMRLTQTAAQLVPGAGAPFASYSQALFEKLPATLESAHGPVARNCFNIGVQLRLIARIVEEDREVLDPNDASEIRKSLTIVQTEAESAQFADPAFEVIKSIGTALNEKPQFQAIRHMRQLVADLMEKLSDYDEALKLVPRGGKKKK